MAPMVAESLGCEVVRRDPTRLDRLVLRAPRVETPAALAGICSTTTADRAGHSYGKSFRDVVRGFRGEIPGPPDAVARPRNERELSALLDWCGTEDIAAIPYGAGSSVVGGVDTGGDWSEDFNGVISLDLGEMNEVIEVDRRSPRPG